MKKLIPLFLILVFTGLTLQAQQHGHFHPGKLDSVQVTGKAIVKIVDTTHTRYYLDTNSDGKADYTLDFGPSWYVPANSKAVRPANGDAVTIIGGKFTNPKDSTSIIVVYQINGLFWRDPYFAEWNDVGKRDTISGGFVHPRDPHHGYGSGPQKDSVVTMILTGTALVDTTLKMDRYFLDTDGDATPNYILNFGPFWYKPASGAVRPLNGDKITIKAGVLGAKSKYPMAVVYELNGKIWRDSTVLHVSVGGKWFSANNTTKITAMYDSDDNLQVQQGRMDNRMMNEFAAQLLESYPENMPAYKTQNMIAAYELSVYDNQGNDYMWTNAHSNDKMAMSSKVAFQLHYTDAQLEFYGLSENNLKVKVWNEQSNNWQTLNATVNTSTNTVKFESTSLNNYYALIGSTVTDVADENTIPTGYDLQQNYPNPFNPTTTISFSIPVAGNVSLKIFDILGNEVANLVNGYKDAGNYTVQFNGRNLSSGVYFYQIISGSYSAVKKLTLMK